MDPQTAERWSTRFLAAITLALTTMSVVSDRPPWVTGVLAGLAMAIGARAESV